MTIKKLSSLLSLAVAMMMSTSEAAQRVGSFDEALQKAGSDGIIAYCYGPDWNLRSVRLLNSFWNSSKTAEAAGDAILVAVPFYENPDSTGARQAATIRGRMEAPPYLMCPALLFFDESGHCYAKLTGSDYLGNDETCSLGVKNIKATLALLRKRHLLVETANATTGAEKAKLLSQAADLPIEASPELLREMKNADPMDTHGCIRRHQFDAMAFIYDLLETTDGEIDPAYVPDYRKIMHECEKIYKDKALKPRDRQIVYSLYIGQSRREKIHSNRLKALIRNVGRLDSESNYGKLSPNLVKLWGKTPERMTPEERREAREKKKAQEKEKKDKKRHERNVKVN